MSDREWLNSRIYVVPVASFRPQHRVYGLLALAPLVLVAMNIIYALGAYPAGKLSDRVSARAILAAGMICLILADLALAILDGIGGAFVGIALWGAHMALTQGLFAKLVADTAASELRGSAYGLFNLATGLTMLFASVIAGIVWDRFGADATFLIGAVFALLAMALLFVRGRPPIRPEHLAGER